MGRVPCCEKSRVKKGPWTPEENEKLVAYIKKHGQGNWRTLPKNAGLARCGKSCRLRWTNYLRPDIKRGRFTFQEEDTIIQLHSILGNKWSAIAARLPGRTDNEIKNYWNTTIRKRLLRMGIDPVTHAPRLDLDLLSTALLTPTSAYCYPYHPTQAAADLDMLRALDLEPLANNYEPDPDLLRLASTLLSGPAAAAIGDQQLLPWFLQPATMAQQVVAPPPEAEQFVAQHAACQMPDLQMVHTNPTLQQHQLAPAQQQQYQPQDMMAAVACCHGMQPPTGYVVDSLLDVPALMQMQMVQAADASILLQWSTTVHTNPTSTVQQRQLTAAQQEQHQPQDMMAAAACHCHCMQPPTDYVVDSLSLLDVPALMQMQMVQAADVPNLQQWSSTVTSSSSSNNNFVGSVINYYY